MRERCADLRHARTFHRKQQTLVISVGKHQGGWEGLDETERVCSRARGGGDAQHFGRALRPGEARAVKPAVARLGEVGGESACSGQGLSVGARAHAGWHETRGQRQLRLVVRGGRGGADALSPYWESAARKKTASGAARKSSAYLAPLAVFLPYSGSWKPYESDSSK